LPEKLERQRALRQLETKRTDAWKAFDEAAREIDRQKDALLDEISHRLQQKTEQVTLFTTLSSNSKCNTASPDGLRCCHDNKMLHTLEC
jgi:hypothetical protein